MTSVNVYLTFNGNCREAFGFYKSVFGGEYSYAGTFGEMPPQEGMPPMSESMKNQLMHISLPISAETTLMGSDAGDEWGPKIIVGNNFSISVNTDSTAEADRIFKGLSNSGIVTMPMAKQFWDAYFGMLTDKFGVNWMVSCDAKGH